MPKRLSLALFPRIFTIAFCFSAFFSVVLLLRENNVLRTRFTVVRFAVTVDILPFYLHPLVCLRAVGVLPAAFSLRLHIIVLKCAARYTYIPRWCTLHNALIIIIFCCAVYFFPKLKNKIVCGAHTHTMLVSAVSVHVCFAFDSLPNKHFSIFPFLHLIQRYLDIRIQ